MWIIVRHGETLHNVKRICQGHYNSLLTLKGIDQIKSIGYRISDICRKLNLNEFKLVSSPMIRTQHTMQILQEVLKITNSEVILENLLSEINAGENTNKRVSIDYNVNDYWTYKPNGGESHIEAYKRLEKFIEKYKNVENMIITTHGFCVKYIVNILQNQMDNSNNMLEESNQNYFYVWNGKSVLSF